MELRLKVLSGCHADRVITIGKPKFLIGRASNCDLRMKSQQVSRRHCRILFEDPHVIVEDLMSSNGTFVNDTRIEGRHLLRVGDRITVRPLDFEVCAIALAAIVPVEYETTRVAVVAEGDDEFESSVSQWMSSEEGARATNSPGAEEQSRVNLNDTVALGQSDTVKITSQEVKQQVAEAESKAKSTQKPASQPLKRFVPPRPDYADSGHAAAESLRAFFNRK